MDPFTANPFAAVRLQVAVDTPTTVLPQLASAWKALMCPLAVGECRTLSVPPALRFALLPNHNGRYSAVGVPMGKRPASLPTATAVTGNHRLNAPPDTQPPVRASVPGTAVEMPSVSVLLFASMVPLFKVSSVRTVAFTFRVRPVAIAVVRR